jgi:hypothetical protein
MKQGWWSVGKPVRWLWSKNCSSELNPLATMTRLWCLHHLSLGVGCFGKGMSLCKHSWQLSIYLSLERWSRQQSPHLPQLCACSTLLVFDFYLERICKMYPDCKVRLPGNSSKYIWHEWKSWIVISLVCDPFSLYWLTTKRIFFHWRLL